MYDVIVAGGGISGLTAAWKLKTKNLSVALVEAGEKPGGNLKTVEHEHFKMETGPHSFMGSSEYTWRLVEELAFDEMVRKASPVSNNRYIWRHNHLKPLPLSAWQFITTKLLSASSKIRLGMEPFIPGNAKDLDTAWDFFVRRFGEEAATYIMGPFVSGVYAGDPKMIGARASFNKFWSFENDYGSMIIGSYFYMRAKKKRLKAQGEYIRKGLHSFKGGLGALTSRLSEELADDIVSGIELQDIRKEGSAWKLKGGTWSGSAKSIIFAMPPHKLAPVIESIDVETSNHLSKIPMAPVLVAHWSYPAEEERVPPGFGFLMPRIFDLKVLGTLFPSHLFPDRTPNGHNLLASFYGGMLEPDTMKLNDEEFIQLVKREHEIILGTNSERMRILKVMRYPNAIPQLLPGHPENIDTIRMLLSRTPGIILAGNYLTGVGMEHAVHSGFTAFENCMRFLSGPKGI